MEKWYWVNEDSTKFLSRGYLSKGQGPQERVKLIGKTAEKLLGIQGYADKFEDYVARGWYSLASPVWSNFGNEKGLPISCNGSYINDSMFPVKNKAEEGNDCINSGIIGKAAEIGAMTKFGAGTSAYFGKIRPRGTDISTGGKASGPVHYMELYDSMTNIVSQSNVRRGSFAAYLDVDHPDIEEFLQIKSEGHRIQNISIGVCISDKWMQSMIDGDKEKRKIWTKIIQKRFESGYPYLFFTDTVNNNAPQVYKDKRMKIHASNLCSEIMLPSSINESFVCDLSSMNILHYDEWKDTDAVETLTYFLDAVMSEYIEKVKYIPFMEAAYNFAVRHRALGIGVLGWHSYLQSKMIAFESMEAKRLNVQIFKLIQEKSYKASEEMAIRYGEPEVMKGYGRRNSTTMAVAPTTSSSFILGQVSPSTEALNSNYFTKDLEKGKFTYKNPYLKEIFIAHNQDNKETWQSVLIKGGSVQHLDFLSQHEKDVFKTFGEISQKEIVIQAAARQKYIDQGQSLNLMIHPDTSPKEASELLIEGWKLGLKTFYYQRGTNPAQELGRSNILACKSCEG
jgi:ribonucleoside-diphosphate reductase alpha chain